MIYAQQVEQTPDEMPTPTGQVVTIGVFLVVIAVAVVFAVIRGEKRNNK